MSEFPAHSRSLRVGILSTAVAAIGWACIIAPAIADPGYNSTVLNHNPAGYWSLVEFDQPPVVADLSTQVHDGQLQGNLPTRSGPFLNADSKAYQFSGDGYVSIPTAAQGITGGFTVEAWVTNETLPQAWSRVVSNGSSSGKGWAFGTFDDRLTFSSYFRQDYISPVPLPRDGYFHQIAVSVAMPVAGSGKVTLFLDGAAVDSKNVASVLASDLNLTIGRNPTGLVEPWNGAIDQVAIYGQLLTEAQILEHYRATSLVMPTGGGVYRWDNGLLLPHTHALVPGPGVDFSWTKLEYADLAGRDLSGANFQLIDLTNAKLTGANLTRANLTNARLAKSDLAGALITDARLRGVTSYGFTPRQLYATASYQQQQLGSVNLSNNYFPAWNFIGQDLSGASFQDSPVPNSVFDDATVRGVDFSGSGLTYDQLLSTRSYRQRSLGAIGLQGSNLTGWDLSHQDLAGARLQRANLTNVQFTGADLTGAHLEDTNLAGVDFAGAQIRGVYFPDNHSLVRPGLTKEQLYSTASYHDRELPGVSLRFNDLSGWDLTGQNLMYADLTTALLANTRLSSADLRGAKWDGVGGAIVDNTIRPDGSLRGLNLPAGARLVLRDQNAQGEQTPVPVTVSSQFSLAAGSTLEMRLLDSNWASTMIVRPNILVELAGAQLDVTMDRPPTLFAPGTSFQLFRWPTADGPADRFHEIETPLGTAWDLSPLYTQGFVTLLGISSDLDADQDVDSKDLLDFLANWTGSENTGEPLTWRDGDSDSDGDVDSADMLVFLNHWTGAEAEVVRVASVPEPDITWAGLLSGLTIAQFGRRRRSSAQPTEDR